MLIKKYLIVFVFTLLSSCSKEVPFKEVKLKSLAKNASLPESLVKLLSENFKKANPELKLSEKQIFNKFGFFSKEIWPIKVKLWSASEAEAKQYNIFDSAVRLDINSFISRLKKNKKFNLSIEIKTQKFNKLYVYFIPSLKDKNSKCTNFFDISSFYQNELSQKVILSLNKEHYLKNYIGTYVFFSPLNKDVYQLNLLQLTDSSKADRLCSFF